MSLSKNFLSSKKSLEDFHIYSLTSHLPGPNPASLPGLSHQQLHSLPSIYSHVLPNCCKCNSQVRKPLSPLSAHFGLIRRLGWLYVLEVQHPGHERGNGTSVLWTKLPRLALSSPITNAHFEKTIRGSGEREGGREKERERTLSIM